MVQRELKALKAVLVMSVLRGLTDHKARSVCQAPKVLKVS